MLKCPTEGGGTQEVAHQPDLVSHPFEGFTAFVAYVIIKKTPLFNLKVASVKTIQLNLVKTPEWLDSVLQYSVH